MPDSFLHIKRFNEFSLWFPPEYTICSVQSEKVFRERATQLGIGFDGIIGSSVL